MEITVNMLKLIRSKARHTQGQLAKATGYSKSFIQKVEQGECKLSKEATLRIVRAYELEREQLEQLREDAKKYEDLGLF